MAAAASLRSVVAPFRRSSAVAAGLAAAGPSAPRRRVAVCRSYSSWKAQKEQRSLFDRGVTSEFLGSGEDTALSAADRLIRQPPPAMPGNTQLYAAPPPTEEEDTLKWDQRSRQEKEQLLGNAFMKSVDPTYFKPRLITPPHGIKVGRLTAWGYKPQYLNLWLDFAQRVAVALKIPCSKIHVLPDAVRRYSIFKAQTSHKIKDTWEWRRHVRQIDIFDAHPDVVDRWLHYTGTNVGDHTFWNFDRFTYDELGVGKRMLEQAALEEMQQSGRSGSTEQKASSR